MKLWNTLRKQVRRQVEQIGRAVSELVFDRGRILSLRQWYLGFCRALCEIERQLAGCPAHRLMNRPDDIRSQFDKPRCDALLVQRPPGEQEGLEARDLLEMPAVAAGFGRAFPRVPVAAAPAR